MTAQMAARSVASRRPPSSAVSVWINHADRATGYPIDLTPLTEPGTYYAAMNWDGRYAGLQRALHRGGALPAATRDTPLLTHGGGVPWSACQPSRHSA